MDTEEASSKLGGDVSEDALGDTGGECGGGVSVDSPAELGAEPGGSVSVDGTEEVAEKPGYSTLPAATSCTEDMRWVNIVQM